MHTTLLPVTGLLRIAEFHLTEIFKSIPEISTYHCNSDRFQIIPHWKKGISRKSQRALISNTYSSTKEGVPYFHFISSWTPWRTITSKLNFLQDGSRLSFSSPFSCIFFASLTFLGSHYQIFLLSPPGDKR